MQGWYAGRVDRWFRRYGDMRRYLRVAPDGEHRDIYVSSTALPDPAVLDSIVTTATAPVWFITSGEAAVYRRQYFDAVQEAWLDSLSREREPVFVGADEVSAVYCLNCDSSGQLEVSPTSGLGAEDVTDENR